MIKLCKLKANACRKQFIKENGETFEEGEIIKMPQLAQTLRRIAAEGGDSFYRGRLARDIMADLTEAGKVLEIFSTFVWGVTSYRFMT